MITVPWQLIKSDKMLDFRIVFNMHCVNLLQYASYVLSFAGYIWHDNLALTHCCLGLPQAVGQARFNSFEYEWKIV